MTVGRINKSIIMFRVDMLFNGTLEDGTIKSRRCKKEESQNLIGQGHR